MFTNRVVPEAGRDYPRTIKEFDSLFADEQKCRQYLARLRWPSGFVCPRCGVARDAWVTARGYLHCRVCEGETSLTAGTVFQGTRNSLRTWYQAIWFVTSQKYGASALGLQRVLGLGSYQTAWTWLHKLRRIMVRPGRDRLNGYVEVDETYVGGEEEGVHGRETYKKAIVAVAAEIKEPRGFGRIRMRRIADVSGESLVPFICDSVERGSTVHTDGWGGYNQTPKHGYTRQITVVSASGDPAHVSMPGVHRIAALLKRWLLGTHQGAVTERHLDYYLDEFTFRFNRRKSGSRGLLFYRLMQQAATTPAVPYRHLVGGILGIHNTENELAPSG